MTTDKLCIGCQAEPGGCHEHPRAFHVGKLRRPSLPNAAITYEHDRGILIEYEDGVPGDPVKAAEWCLRSGGWIRVCGAAKHTSIQGVRDFLNTWGSRGAKP